MFNWSNYLKIANEFLVIPDTSPDAEAYYRCGISRAYYAVYHKAENFLKSRNIQIQLQPKEGPHQAVIRLLAGIEVQVGGDLGRLKKIRIKSDYDENATINRAEFTNCLYLAASISGKL